MVVISRQRQVVSSTVAHEVAQTGSERGVKLPKFSPQGIRKPTATNALTCSFERYST